MKRVLAIDPGGTTGISMLTFDQYANDLTRMTWTTTEIAWPDHHSYLRAYLSREILLYEASNRSGQEALVICEGWDNRGKPDAELISIEYIGVVKGWAQEMSIKLLMPLSAAKEFTDDRKLKALDMFTRSKHINDATRHLVKWLACDLKYRPVLQVFYEKLVLGRE
jgi:hypothetical protein